MFPARPVNLNDPMAAVTKVAEKQPQFQTLPAIYMWGYNVCVSRWVLEDDELEHFQNTRTLWLYQQIIPGKSLTGFFLSSKFINDSELNLRYTDRVFTQQESNYVFIFPSESNQPNHAKFRWSLSDEQFDEVMRDYSVYIYQFNKQQPITPMLISVYENQLVS